VACTDSGKTWRIFNIWVVYAKALNAFHSGAWEITTLVQAAVVIN
jgi:hypothetical protein